MAYRDGLDALRERYLALLAERDDTPAPSRRYRELEREIDAVAISIDARAGRAPAPKPPRRRRLLLALAVAVPALLGSALVANELMRPPPIPASDAWCNDCSCRPFAIPRKTPLERWLGM